MSPIRRRLGSGPLLLILPLVLLASSSAARAQESWDAVFMGGKKVGFIHTQVTPVKDRGKDLLRVRLDMELRFKRLKDNMTIKMRYGTIETLAGEVLRLDTRTLVGNSELRTFGDVIKGQMKLTLEGSGQSQESVIPWGPEVRGPYAAELSLSRTPIKPGETRELRMYIPDINKICETKLVAKEPEAIVLGDGKRSLLRVEQIVTLEGKPLPECDLTLWVDSGGQVLKTRTDHGAMGMMESFRTTREGAMSGGDEPQMNLTQASIIKVVHKIDRPGTRRNIVYRVGLKDQNPINIIPMDRRQTLRTGTKPSDTILQVVTAGPADGAPGPAAVDPEFLRPNTLITSQDANVVRLAQTAVAGAVDPWDKATKIEHWVAENLKQKNFETAFAPASEVAITLAGDCTEHSVLAAAMCRAQGIPSRVVVGLVYADYLGGFGYHMWNEVYVNRRWVALDSAFDQTSVDAVHIKLGDTSLEGVSPFAAFLPVARVMGKLTLEPLEIR